jgi:hypothetical protein
VVEPWMPGAARDAKPMASHWRAHGWRSGAADRPHPDAPDL